MAFAEGYIDVATRVAEFRAKHPEGSLQQVSLDFKEFGGKSWVIYTAAAYRTANDVRPGMGTAWEEVPGPTSFTKDSELQNAETSAWGRALVAVLAADTKAGIASAQEIRNDAAKVIDTQALITYAESLPDSEAVKALWTGLAGFPQPIRDGIAMIARDRKAQEGDK